MLVISKLKSTYGVKHFINFCLIVFVISFSVYIAFYNRWFSHKMSILWFTIFVVIYFTIYLIIVFNKLKQLIVTNNGIAVSYLFGRRILFFHFTEITNFKTRRPIHAKDAENALIYCELEIEFTNHRRIQFSADQFDNYMEIKNSIYDGKRKYSKFF